MTALYDQLSVEPDATPAEIRAAHRRAAKRTHPDKPGGDAEAFVAVSRAWMVLSDPAKRAKYDATGDESDQPDNRAAEVVAILTGTFGQVMTQTAVEHWPRINLVAGMQRLIAAERQAIVPRIAAATKHRDALQQAQKRLVHSGDGTNSLGNVIAQQLVLAEAQILGLQARAERLGEALEAAAGYDWTLDPPPATVTTSTGSTPTWSFAT